MFDSKVNSVSKSEVLTHYVNALKYERKVSYNNYLLHNNQVDKMTMTPEEVESHFDMYYSDKDYQDIMKVATSINHSSYKRRLRLHERIESMLKSSQCLFLTLTFTDSVLDSTTEETRRKYVRRFLKSFNTQYVANIDYGLQNEREHYHCVIAIDRIEYSKWRYGNIDFERIRLSKRDIETSSKCLSKYIVKLTNHALKDTNKTCYVIYSR